MVYLLALHGTGLKWQSRMKPLTKRLLHLERVMKQLHQPKSLQMQNGESGMTGATKRSQTTKTKQGCVCDVSSSAFKLQAKLGKPQRNEEAPQVFGVSSLCFCDATKEKHTNVTIQACLTDIDWRMTISGKDILRHGRRLPFSNNNV